MPVLNIGGYMDNRAGQYLYCRLALFLIPATASHTDEHLSATLRGVMEVPVVATPGLKGNIRHRHLLGRDGGSGSCCP